MPSPSSPSSILWHCILRLSAAHEASGKDLETARRLAVGEVEVERGGVAYVERARPMAYEMKRAA